MGFNYTSTSWQVIVDSCADYLVTPRREWVLKWPGATLIAGSSIYWTVEVRPGPLTVMNSLLILMSGDLNTYAYACSSYVYGAALVAAASTDWPSEVQAHGHDEHCVVGCRS